MVALEVALEMHKDWAVALESSIITAGYNLYDAVAVESCAGNPTLRRFFCFFLQWKMRKIGP
jgi:hypothetical protein